jgi:hypothetical protein
MQDNLILLQFIKKRPWVLVKFFLLFTAIALFVSFNFSMMVGLPLATAITLLSVAHWRIFDKASDAFFDIRKDDAAGKKTEKVAVTIAKRIFYSSLDYILAGLSIWLVIAVKNHAYSYLEAAASMWLLIDLPSAGIFVAIYEKTGRDMTLGRAYRRMANTILEHSKVAGVIVFLYEITLASFWSGADYTVLFFRDELKTRTRLALAALAITAFHAALWTAVYWLGHDNVLELINYLKG